MWLRSVAQRYGAGTIRRSTVSLVTPTTSFVPQQVRYFSTTDDKVEEEKKEESVEEKKEEVKEDRVVLETGVVKDENDKLVGFKYLAKSTGKGLQTLVNRNAITGDGKLRTTRRRMRKNLNYFYNFDEDMIKESPLPKNEEGKVTPFKHPHGGDPLTFNEYMRFRRYEQYSKSKRKRLHKRRRIMNPEHRDYVLRLAAYRKEVNDYRRKWREEIKPEAKRPKVRLPDEVVAEMDKHFKGRLDHISKNNLFKLFEKPQMNIRYIPAAPVQEKTFKPKYEEGEYPEMPIRSGLHELTSLKADESWIVAEGELSDHIDDVFQQTVPLTAAWEEVLPRKISPLAKEFLTHNDYRYYNDFSGIEHQYTVYFKYVEDSDLNIAGQEPIRTGPKKSYGERKGNKSTDKKKKKVVYRKARK